MKTNHRIVSLIASSTETVSALGFEDQLVGRSHECDYPPSVTNLPICSEPKINVHGSSKDIDNRIRDVLREALSVYNVHVDILKKLNPTHIITQDHCEVCAVSLKDVKQAACEILPSKPKIVSLAPNDLSDVYQGILEISEALSEPQCGENLVNKMKDQMAEIQSKTKDIRKKPTLAYIEWIEPLMTGGNWMPRLIEMAGGTNILGKAGEHSPSITFNTLQDLNPEFILISPCGYDIKKTEEEINPLIAHPNWNNLKAVMDKKTFIADGNQFFNRPGPRLVESLQILAEILHPEIFDFGHQSKGWINLS